MDRVRTAVIGAGYFGSHHARKHAAIPTADLVAVCDVSEAAAARLAGEVGCEVVTDHRDLVGRVDAVSIATPTAFHFPVARDLIEAGIGVLIEKPLCATLAEADQLIGLSRERGVVLQVGHLERFNATVAALEPLIDRPGFIQCDRISPYRGRGTDVSVVMDMMIHDIDLVLTLVRSPIEWIDAVGVPVLSDADDISSARIRFESGCVATFTASRVSWKTQRTMRVFQHNAYLMADLNEGKLTVTRRTATEDGGTQLTSDTRTHEKRDALEAEVAAFIEAVRTGSQPKVSGEDGRAALEAALEINRLMRAWTDRQRRAHAGQ